MFRLRFGKRVRADRYQFFLRLFGREPAFRSIEFVYEVADFFRVPIGHLYNGNRKSALRRTFLFICGPREPHTKTCGPGGNRTPASAMRMPCNTTLLQAHKFLYGVQARAFLRLLSSRAVFKSFL